MVELQLDLASYISKASTFLQELFENLTMDLEEFFDELDLMHECKSEGESYKVGEIWKHSDGDWKLCQPGGVIQGGAGPCPFSMAGEGGKGGEGGEAKGKGGKRAPAKKQQ